MSICRHDGGEYAKERKANWLREGLWLEVKEVDDGLINRLSSNNEVILCVELINHLSPADLIRLIYALRRNTIVYTLLLKNAFNTDQFDHNSNAKNKVLSTLSQLMQSSPRLKEICLDGNVFSTQHMKLLMQPKTNMKLFFFRHGNFSGVDGLIEFAKSFTDDKTAMPFISFEGSINKSELINNGSYTEKLVRLTKFLSLNPLFEKKICFDTDIKKIIDDIKKEHEQGFGKPIIPMPKAELRLPPIQTRAPQHNPKPPTKPRNPVVIHSRPQYKAKPPTLPPELAVTKRYSLFKPQPPSARRSSAPTLRRGFKNL